VPVKTASTLSVAVRLGPVKTAAMARSWRGRYRAGLLSSVAVATGGRAIPQLRQCPVRLGRSETRTRMQQPPGTQTTQRRRRRRWPIVVLAWLVVLAAVFYLGGGWYFSGRLYQQGLNGAATRRKAQLRPQCRGRDRRDRHPPRPNRPRPTPHPRRVGAAVADGLRAGDHDPGPRPGHGHASVPPPGGGSAGSRDPGGAGQQGLPAGSADWSGHRLPERRLPGAAGVLPGVAGSGVK
jgi:hypothetical protein